MSPIIWARSGRSIVLRADGCWDIVFDGVREVVADVTFGGLRIAVLTISGHPPRVMSSA